MEEEERRNNGQGRVTGARAVFEELSETQATEEEESKKEERGSKEQGNGGRG